MKDGDDCPECGGTMEYPPVENCSCHICPPCSQCTDNKIVCEMCGWSEDTPAKTEAVIDYDLSWLSPNHGKWAYAIPDGKRLYDVDYDSSSGSTMVFRGKIEGDVTAQEIITAIGDGTFGHRGPVITGDRFTYTKITD